MICKFIEFGSDLALHISSIKTLFLVLPKFHGKRPTLLAVLIFTKNELLKGQYRGVKFVKYQILFVPSACEN